MTVEKSRPTLQEATHGEYPSPQLAMKYPHLIDEYNDSREARMTHRTESDAPSQPSADAPVRGTLAFFASCIRSGEPWTETCQRSYDRAMAALDASQPRAPDTAPDALRELLKRCRPLVTTFIAGCVGRRDRLGEEQYTKLRGEIDAALTPASAPDALIERLTMQLEQARESERVALRALTAVASAPGTGEPSADASEVVGDYEVRSHAEVMGGEPSAAPRRRIANLDDLPRTSAAPRRPDAKELYARVYAAADSWAAGDPSREPYHAIYAAGYMDALVGTPPASTRPADPDDQAARESYEAHTTNHPTIHTNRFPSWSELPQSERDKWASTRPASEVK